MFNEVLFEESVGNERDERKVNVSCACGCGAKAGNPYGWTANGEPLAFRKCSVAYEEKQREMLLYAPVESLQTSGA